MQEIPYRRHPAILGACITAGVWSYPHWLPSPGELSAAIAALCSLGMLCALARRKTAWFALHAASFLTGSWLCARLPEPSAPADGWLVGEVVQSSGRRALVSSDAGRVELSFSGPAPARGRTVAAWYGTARPAAILEGDPDPLVRLRRARAVQRRAREWEPVGPAGIRQEPPEHFLHAEHGGLLWALASGDRSLLPSHHAELLRNTGVSHLIAISGLHVGLVSGIVWLVLRICCTPLAHFGWIRLSAWAPAIAASLAATGYAALAGWPASAQRAAIMVSAAAAARACGRSADPWNLLGTAAVIMLLSEPSEFDSLGFQLSFSAVAGILLVAPRFTRLLPPDTPWPASWCAASLGASFGAVSGTLPVAALHFQSIPPLSPLANLFAVPLVGAVAVPASLLAMALPAQAAAVPIVIGDAAASAAFWLLSCLPPLQWHPAASPLSAAALLPLPFLRKRPASMLALYALLLARFPGTPSLLTVTFLSVGQGDAALVEWPDGRRWLVDGGPPSTRLLRYLRRKGIRHLDAVIISHPHPDHFGGLLPVSENIGIGTAFAPRPPDPGEAGYGELWESLAAGGAQPGFPGDPLGEGAELLHPLDGWNAGGRNSVNEESLVVLIAYGARRFLFTGDIGAQAEARLAGRTGHVDVLKVPHHGSRTSSSRSFVAETRPLVALVSCGPGNRFGHPHREAMDSLAGSRVLRTDLDGSIEISTDGRKLAARSWLPGRGWNNLALQAEIPQSKIFGPD